MAISKDKKLPNDCAKCMAAVHVMQEASRSNPPATITKVLIQACNTWKFSGISNACTRIFSNPVGLGPYWAQLFAKMTNSTGDYQAFCAIKFGHCNAPKPVKIDETVWFGPKPVDKMTAPPPSGV